MNAPIIRKSMIFIKRLPNIVFSCLLTAWKISKPFVKFGLLMVAAGNSHKSSSKKRDFFMDSSSASARKTNEWHSERNKTSPSPNSQKY